MTMTKWGAPECSAIGNKSISSYPRCRLRSRHRRKYFCAPPRASRRHQSASEALCSLMGWCGGSDSVTMCRESQYEAVICTTMSRLVEQHAEQHYSLTQSTNPHFSQRTTLQAGRSSYSGRKDTRTTDFPHRLQSPDSLWESDLFSTCRWASVIALLLRSLDQSPGAGNRSLREQCLATRVPSRRRPVGVLEQIPVAHSRSKRVDAYPPSTTRWRNRHIKEPFCA